MADTMKMQYDLDVLSSKLSDFQTISSDLLDTKKTMNQIKNDSDSFWQGPASNVFRTKSGELAAKITKQKSQIDVCKQNLADAIAVYRQTEQQNEGIVDNLSTEDIF